MHQVIDFYRPFACILGLGLHLGVSAQTPPGDGHWELYWQDDFTFFDENRWDKAIFSDHSGEPQLYLPDNVTISSEGELVLALIPTAVLCADNAGHNVGVGGSPCHEGVVYPLTSGWVETNSASDIRFGYVEARIKMPRQKYFFFPGEDYWYETWSAFWTWRGHGVNGANETEIDIFESYAGSMSWDKLGSNVHLAYSTPTQQAVNFPSDIEVGDYPADYHLYGVQWDPEKIIWYFDGMPVRTLANHYVRDPARIILNLAVRGNDELSFSTGDWQSIYPKPPVIDYPGPAVPCYMYVDYVRVYKLKEDCDEVIHTNAYNYAQYPMAVVNYVSLGNGGQWNQPTGTAFIRASEYVDLMMDYTFPVGTDLHLEAVSTCTNDLTGLCFERIVGCAVNGATMSGQVKRSIEIGGNECSVNGSSGQENIDARAAEWIMIGPNTTILPTVQASVVLRIDTCE
ncbi:MAG TPA: glycoside hydrolase family 16 protein [Flavobacteriales bacterium]|nr:glycoside hydrolase family 16 protein [Flavobacteriales bacterium]